MLKLFYAPTPPSLRALLFLEEIGMDYKKFPINVFKKENLKPEYTKVNPLQKTPALIDNKEVHVDSANILLHLAQKQDVKLSNEELSWFFWGTSELNPKFMHHIVEFLGGSSNVEMMDKIKEQLHALLEVLNNELSKKKYLGGEIYSIADMNVYATIKMYVLMDFIPNLLNGLPNIQNWIAEIDSKPSVQKVLGMAMAFDKEAESNPEDILNFFNS